jgi:opacity protein-like surface antigen
MNNVFLRRMAIAIIAAVTMSAATVAQVKFGVKAGVNLSQLSDVTASGSGVDLKMMEKDGMTVGYHAGVFANISFGSTIGFQPELLFSMQGGKQKLSELFSDVDGEDLTDASVSYQLGYVAMPLLLEFKPAGDLGILVGPQVGYNLMRKATSEYNGEKETISGDDFDDEFNPLRALDAGLVVGLQYKFAGKAYLGVRYYLGFLDGINESQDGATIKGFKNNVLQASVGYAF